MHIFSAKNLTHVPFFDEVARAGELQKHLKLKGCVKSRKTLDTLIWFRSPILIIFFGQGVPDK